MSELQKRKTAHLARPKTVVDERDFRVPAARLVCAGRVLGKLYRLSDGTWVARQRFGVAGPYPDFRRAAMGLLRALGPGYIDGSIRCRFVVREGQIL